MAVTNSLSRQKNDKSNQLVTFTVNGAKVELSPAIVKDYLVSGDKERVTMQEIVMFINLCKFNGLNPWLKEAYCIKYGNEPATMVTAKEALQKRAENNPAFDGQQSGIITLNANDEINYRTGTFYIADLEKIVGGWAEVWRTDRTHSFRAEVSYDEYEGRKKDGSPNSQWAKKPATMIKKVALAQALREAFPQDLGAMYTAEEQGVDDSIIDVTPINQPQEQTATADDYKTLTEPTPQAQADDVASALFG